MSLRSLYVSRKLLNGAEVARWFLNQGLPSVYVPADMHVTIVYSRQPMWWAAVPEDDAPLVIPSGPTWLERLGESQVVALRFDAPVIEQRHQAYRDAGASADYPTFRPHVTISAYGAGIDLRAIKPFPGALHFGPEIRKPITKDWTAGETKEVRMQDMLDKAMVARMPAIIKARPSDASGRRIVEVQASCEAVDFDGDVILQEALLNSAASFIATGHLDIDHLSEFGQRLGIPDPSSYIVGRPLEVRAGPNNSTFVVGEISRSIDGAFDVQRNKYDELWASLQRNPPVTWFSSVYGWPTDMDDCESGQCSHSGATRYLIKAMDWRSLAFTRSPKNTALNSPTRILTAKSFLAELAKSMPPSMALPNSMPDAVAASMCKSCGVHAVPSLLGYRQHFAKCMGYPPEAADLLGHALMYKCAMDRSLTGPAGL